MSLVTPLLLTGFFALTWYVPGMALARLVGSRLGLSGPVHLAVCAAGGPVLFDLNSRPQDYTAQVAD